MEPLDVALLRHGPRVVAWPAGDAASELPFAVWIEAVSDEDAARLVAHGEESRASLVRARGGVRVTGSAEAFERLARVASETVLGALPKETLARFRRRSFRLATATGEMVLGPKPCLMGVLNVTPDSFSDGGRYATVAAAVEKGRQLVDAGAHVLDVGGESTRPGADDVPEDEEIRRVVPVIRELAHSMTTPLSVDTRKSRVAAAAIEAGAAIVNDVSGLEYDPRIVDVVRESGAALVICHVKGTPQTMTSLARYDDLLGEVSRSLRERVGRAAAAGVAENALLVDPGIGFAKKPEHSLEILRRLPELRSLGLPLVVGPSRKSFVGAVTGKPASERAFGTAAAVASVVQSGAAIVRVHDVAEMRDVAEVAAAIRGEAAA